MNLIKVICVSTVAAAVYMSKGNLPVATPPRNTVVATINCLVGPSPTHAGTLTDPVLC